MISMDQLFQRNGSVEEMEVEKEWVLLHADRFTITRINELGGFCWSMLEQPISFEALTKGVTQRFHVPEEEASRDMEMFLKELMAYDLVKRA
jgi:hypothetical protein